MSAHYTSTRDLQQDLEQIYGATNLTVHETAAFEAWEFSQWYKPDVHQLTNEEFREKYNRNPEQFEDDGLEPGAA